MFFTGILGATFLTSFYCQMMDEAVGESQSGKSCKQTQEAHNTSCPFDETVIYACGDNKDLSDLEDVGDLQQLAQSSLIESPDKIKCEEIYISSASSPEPDTVKCEEIYISSGSSPGFKDTDPAPSLFRRGQTFKREPESPPIPPPYGRQIRQHSPTMEISFKSLSSDSESPPRNPDKIEYHNNDKRLPIHSQPSSGLDSGNILRICFGEVSDDLICEIKPVSVRTNSVFVVDLNSVSLKSLYADDNGIWETSSPRRHYNVEMDAGRVSAISSSHKGDFTHILIRQYGRHKTSFERKFVFNRIISTVKSRNGTQSRYAVVQYILKNCTSEDIVLAPHGNSLGKRSHFKTDPSVLEKMKDAGEEKPKKFFGRLIAEAGGALATKSASEEPRNRQQIYNVRRDKKRTIADTGTEFGHLMAQLKDNDFVHDLSLSSDSIQYVLASKQQLFDLECFCTGETNYSVFSVDSTFDVGEFFITNTCFENKRVVYADGRYRGKHPMMIGPSFVHTKQETHNYVNFFASIVRMNQNLRNVKAVGTDGEEALMNASLICFENATRLLCCDHKKANIESKLSDLRASEASRKHIIADIFGRRIGSTYENGLIDAETVSIFDKNCRDFKATWDFLVPVFHSWFVKYESELFRKHLIRGVCKSANIDGTFSNNRIESVHKVMKDWLGRKEKISMPVVNSKIKDLLKSDNQEFELTVYGQGAYDLSPDFKYLRVERHEWNSFNQTERQAAIDKFWKSKLKQSTVQSVDYGPSTVTTGSFPSPCSNDSPRQQIITGMSLEFDTNMQISGVTHDHFEEMWKTADLLTAGKDTIVKAPGYDGCFVQHALDVVAKPHLVIWKGITAIIINFLICKMLFLNL